MATEIKKPTANTVDVGIGFNSNPPEAYDFPDTAGDESTQASCYNASDFTHRFHTWAAKGQTYTATVLKCKWWTSGGFDNDQFAIEATKDGGSNWDIILLAMGVHNEVAVQTAQQSLDTNQDLTQVEVRVRFDRVGGGDKDTVYLSDIWTEGEYTGGVTVSPAPASAASSAVIGAIILGLISITPATASAVSSCTNPTVVQSSLAITPASASVASGAADPSVILGNLSITPATAEAVSSAADPTVIQSSLSIIPASANVVSSCADPIVVEGGGDVVVTPAAASVISSATNPTVILGNISITPAAASATSSAANPTVILGNIIIIPSSASVIGSCINPTIIQSSLIITPVSAAVIGSCVNPTVINPGGGIPGYVTDGLLCYWKMDETGGVTLVDNEGNVDMNLLGNYTLGVEGKKNTAVEFEDDGITRAESDAEPSALMNLTAFSVEFWVKMNSWEDSAPYIQGLAKLGGTNYFPFTVRFGDSSIPKERLQLIVRTQWWYEPIQMWFTDEKKIKADADCELYTWYHMILTWDSSDKLMKMYINKQLQIENGETAGDILDYSGDDYLWFGCGLVGRTLDGVLDEIRFYDRALTQAEVDQNYLSHEFKPDTEAPAPPTGLFVDTPPARPSGLDIEDPDPTPTRPTGLGIEDMDSAPARPAGLIIEEV